MRPLCIMPSRTYMTDKRLYPRMWTCTTCKGPPLHTDCQSLQLAHKLAGPDVYTAKWVNIRSLKLLTQSGHLHQREAEKRTEVVSQQFWYQSTRCVLVMKDYDLKLCIFAIIEACQKPIVWFWKLFFQECSLIDCNDQHTSYHEAMIN